jgi:hypothetical protein
MHVLSTVACLLAFTSMAIADCCSASSTCSPMEAWLGGDCPASCDDGTKPTPCCGKGECNAFCCNCDNGKHPFYNVYALCINLTTSTGCRGQNSVITSNQQIPIQKRPAACSYDTTFDSVSGVGSQTITLSDYLVWARSYQPASATNASLLNVWIDFFHRFV